MRMYAGARAREFARGWRMLRVRGSARTQNHRSLDGLAEVLEVYPPWCCKESASSCECQCNGACRFAAYEAESLGGWPIMSALAAELPHRRVARVSGDGEQ